MLSSNTLNERGGKLGVIPMRPKGNREQAYRDYKNLGITHKENAKRQGVSVNTVKSWCKRYRWEERKEAEINHPFPHLFIKRLHKKDA